MFLVPKQCNDMMNLGRLQGYEVNSHHHINTNLHNVTIRITFASNGGATHKTTQDDDDFFTQGKLTAQGKLLQQDTFFVTEQDSGVLSRSKERRVFLFEQIVIFSELLRKGSSTPGYQFKKSIKVQQLFPPRSDVLHAGLCL